MSLWISTTDVPFWLYIIVTVAIVFIFIFVILILVEFYASCSFHGIYHPSPKEKEFINFTSSNSSSIQNFPSSSDCPTVYLTVVVPAYNEEERIPVMLDEALEYLEKRTTDTQEFSYEIIIVDDGSRDKTSEVGRQYTKKFGGSKVRVLQQERNRGKGGAICMGVFSARGRYILMADADGATRFSDIEKLETSLQTMTNSYEDLAIACGSRAHLEKASIAQRSMFRTFLMKGFHGCVRILGGIRGIADTQCGFKLFTRPAALLTFGNLHVQRWCFDVELLYIAQQLNVSCSEIAVNWTEIEGSKIVPVWSWIQMGRDLFLIRLHYLLSVWKLKPKLKSS